MDDDDFESSDDPSNPNIKGEDRRLRREIANSNERKRMQSINAGFETLKSLLPGHQQGERMSKAAVLQQTVELVNSLQVELSRVGAALVHSRRRECANNGCCTSATASDATLAVPANPSNSILPESSLFNERRRNSTDVETDDCDNTTGSLHESSHNDSLVCHTALLHANPDETALESSTEARRLSAGTNASGYTSILTTTGSVSGAKRKLDAALLDADDVNDRFDDEADENKPEKTSSAGASPSPSKFRLASTSAANTSMLSDFILPSISFDAAPSITTAAGNVPVLSDGIKSDQDDEQHESLMQSGKSPNTNRNAGGNACSYLFDIEAITLQVVELRRELDKERRARMRLEEECRRRKLDGPLCAECANKRGRTSRNLVLPTTSASGSELRRAGSSAERSSSSLAVFSGGDTKSELQTKKPKSSFDPDLMRLQSHHNVVPDAVSNRKPLMPNCSTAVENVAGTNNLLLNILPSGNLSLLSAGGGFNLNTNGINALRRSSLGLHMSGGMASSIVKPEPGGDPVQFIQQQQQYDLSAQLIRRQSVDGGNNMSFQQQQQASSLLSQPQFLPSAAVQNIAYPLIQQQQQQLQQYLVSSQPTPSVSTASMMRAVTLDISSNNNSAVAAGGQTVMRLLPANSIGSNLIGSSFIMPSTATVTNSSGQQQQQYLSRQPFLLSAGSARTLPLVGDQQAALLAALQQQQHHQQHHMSSRASSVIAASAQQRYAVQQTAPLTPVVGLNSNSNLQNMFIYNMPTNVAAGAASGLPTSSIFLPSVVSSIPTMTSANLLTSLSSSHSHLPFFPHLSHQVAHHDEQQQEEEHDKEDFSDDEGDSEIQEIYSKSLNQQQHQHQLNDLDALLASNSAIALAAASAADPLAVSFTDRPNLLYSSSTGSVRQQQQHQFMPNLGFNHDDNALHEQNNSSSNNTILTTAAGGNAAALQWLFDAEQQQQHHANIISYVSDDRQQHSLDTAAFNLQSGDDAENSMPTTMTDFDRATAVMLVRQQHRHKQTNLGEQQNLQQHNNKPNEVSHAENVAASVAGAGGNGLGTLLEAIYHIESSVAEQVPPSSSSNTATFASSSFSALTSSAPSTSFVVNISPKKRIQAAVQQQQQQQLLQSSICSNESTAFIHDNAANGAVVPSTTAGL